MTTDLYATAARYGVRFEGTLVGDEYHSTVDHTESYTLADLAAAGGRISRVRILAEYGRGDISYIHATLPDGTVVPVNLANMPSSGIGITMRTILGEFIAWAKAEGVYAKSLGLLDRGNWSILYG